MSKIELELKKGSKVISSHTIKLKDLNVWQELEFNDLLLEHSREMDKNLCVRAGKVVQLTTGMSDDELLKIGSEGILQLFPLIIQEKQKKKLMK